MKARSVAALLLLSCLPMGIPIALIVMAVRRWRGK